MQNSYKTKISFLKELLIGSNKEYSVDHQVLNFTILITAFQCFITIPVNLVLELPIILFYANTFTFIILISLYYLSRIRNIIHNISFIFFSTLMVCFSLNWFASGGIQGSVSFYYFPLFAYIIYLTKGIQQIVLILMLIINVTVLFFLEIHFPKLVTLSPDKMIIIKDMLFSFVTMLIFISVLVFVIKKLYNQERQNTIDLIEQYRNSGETLKKEFQLKYEQLSIREREVFELIIGGKTNKEIAELLYISEQTIKQHINKIYKKLGTNSRIDTINFASEFTKESGL